MEEYPDVQEQTAQSMAAEERVKEVLGTDQTSFAEYLHETSPLPPSLKPFFSVFWDKELGLGNIENNEEFNDIMQMFRICKRNYHIYTPRFEQTAENALLIAQLEARIRIKLGRSKGARNRDRALFVTAYTSHERPQVPQAKGGIFSRIKNIGRNTV